MILMKRQPSILTERLLIRPFTLADAPAVQHIAGHIEVHQTTQYIPHPYPDGLAESWIESLAPAYDQGLQMICGIEVRREKLLIGSIGLDFHKEHENASLGYWMHPGYWNQGYCTEAAKGMVAFGFNVLKLHRIHAKHLVRNPASGRVMQKIGMRHEGVERESTKIRGVFESMVNYAVLRSDFMKLQPAAPSP